MSSFQFPANPSDGDIVVRGNLQAFYNAATNTWRVSEVPTAPGIPGPPGPPGPIGPPGKGAEVSGIVDTFADLPAPNTQQFKYWVVTDTNTLYISDGIQWVELGGPIQGPQGEPGEDGADGSNGQNGRGWYDTNIIDERPNNYQIQFLSNDGLSFVTDNIMGAQGESGDMEVASETNCGCIKIGRGLDIEPDGTASAGETYVDLETVPLGTDGRPDLPTPSSFTLSFNLSYGLFPRSADGIANSGFWQTGPTGEIGSVSIDVPSIATSAIVYWFTASAMSVATTNYQTGDRLYTAGGQVEEFLDVSAPASFEDGLGLGVPMTHNIATHQNQENQRSETPVLKIGKINFPRGTTSVTFKRRIGKSLWKAARWYYGASRVILIPEMDADAQTNTTRTMGERLINLFGTTDTDLIHDSKFQPSPPVTDEQLLKWQADDLRDSIADSMKLIDKLTMEQYLEGTSSYNTLKGLRTQLIELRNLPGTIDDILEAYLAIQNQIVPFNDYKFRFEP